MRLLTAFCMAASMLAASAHAGETAASWLMHHPVTLWDWGMETLSRRTEQAAEKLSGQMGVPLIGRATYSFDKNQIDIFLIASDGLGENNKPCEALRQDFLGAFLRLNDPASLSTFAETLMQDAFSHAGYAEKSRPKTIAADLVEMTRVHVAIAGSPPKKCYAPLTSWTLSKKK